MSNPTLFSEADWVRLERDWTAWWNHDLQRPLLFAINNHAYKPIDRVRPAWWGGGLCKIPHTVPAEAIAREAWEDIRCTSHSGDAWPRFWVDYGPGAAAAYLGAEVEPAQNTAWFRPGIWKNKPLSGIRPGYDPDNPWWQRTQEVTKACVEYFAGRAQVSVTCIGGSLDIAASLRDTMTLLEDCVDDPDAVDELCRRLTPLWLRYYRELYALIAPAGRGTSAWAPLWGAGRTCILESDFAYMISPDLFARFVVPYLTDCCAGLDHSFYHMDGKGQIPHLDHLLAIPGLNGVQWLPGDGQPEAGDPIWWPVLKRIRDAGKLVQIYSSGESVLRMAREVPLTGFVIYTWADNTRHLDNLLEAIPRENAALMAGTTVTVA